MNYEDITLNQFVVNRVPSLEKLNEMKEQGLLQPNQVYLVEGEGLKTIIETVTIDTWSSDSNIEPYKFTGKGTIQTMLRDSSIVELINDNAIYFAKYGFAIGSITGQEITFYAIEQATESIGLKIMVEG